MGRITIDIDPADYLDEILDEMSDEDLMDELAQRGIAGPGQVPDVERRLERAYHRRDSAEFYAVLREIGDALRPKEAARRAIEMKAAYVSCPKMKDAQP